MATIYNARFLSYKGWYFGRANCDLLRLRVLEKAFQRVGSTTQATHELEHQQEQRKLSEKSYPMDDVMGHGLLRDKRPDGQWQDAQDSQPMKYCQHPHPREGKKASGETPPSQKNEQGKQQVNQTYKRETELRRNPVELMNP